MLKHLLQKSRIFKVTTASKELIFAIQPRHNSRLNYYSSSLPSIKQCQQENSIEVDSLKSPETVDLLHDLSKKCISNSTRTLLHAFRNETLEPYLISNLSSQDLKEVVTDLAKAFNCFTGRERTKIFAEGSQEIIRFIDLIRVECVLRLKLRNVNRDKFISTSTEEFEDVLEFCKLWLVLEDRYHKNSFIWSVVNDIGDSETGKSMARFKHFTKDGFVTFCSLMSHVRLGSGFHKYYVIIKILDLFHQMTEEDIRVVCSTISRHSLHLAADHPVNIKLKTKLIDYVHQNFSRIQDKTLAKIFPALNPSLEHHFPQFMIDSVIKIQTSAAKEHTRFEVRTLLALMNVTNNSRISSGDGVDKHLVDVVVERLISSPEDVSDMRSKDIANLALVISKHRDTPLGRYLLSSLLTPRLKELLHQHAKSNTKNVLAAAVQLSHLQLYDAELVNQLLTTVTRPRPDGSVGLARELLYVDKTNNSRAGLAKSAGDVLMLQGMVDMELPGYAGTRITETDFDKKWKAMKGFAPLEIRNNPDNFNSWMVNVHFVPRQLVVYDTLVSLFGEDKVWETYVLPFTGTVSHVVGINGKGEAVTISDNVREQNEFSVKRLSSEESNVKWFSIFLFHPRIHTRVKIMTGGQTVMQRLLRRLNIEAVFINTSTWDSVEDKELLIKKDTSANLKEMEKPRGKCTPYAFFLNVCRDQCKKKLSKDVDFNTLSTVCTDKWNTMSDYHKKRFVQMSQSDAIRYDKEMAKYNEFKKEKDAEKKAEKKEERQKIVAEKKEEKKKLLEEKKAEKKRLLEEKKRKKKDPNAPKNAKSSYIFYVNELREKLKIEQPALSVTEVAKEAGRRWKELSSSAKVKYEKMAADDKLRYEREKAEYESGSGSGSGSGIQTIPSLLQKTGMTPSKKAVTNGNNESSSSSSDSDSSED